MPQDLRGRTLALQWLFWQMGGLGPMAGQNHHFTQYVPETIAYAIERYGKETARLYVVLNKHLADGRTYIAGKYSVADIACYPWIVRTNTSARTCRTFRTWPPGSNVCGRARRPCVPMRLQRRSTANR